MAKQSNTIGHILIELNTAVNVTCHWSDKNRVQGKSRLKPFECVYIAKVGKFFAPSASNIFFFIFAHNTLENTCRILTSSLSETWHIDTHTAPPTVQILSWIRLLIFSQSVHRGMFTKVTPRTEKLLQVRDMVIGISYRQCCQQADTNSGIQNITAFKTGYVSGKQN